LQATLGLRSRNGMGEKGEGEESEGRGWWNPASKAKRMLRCGEGTGGEVESFWGSQKKAAMEEAK